MRDLLAGCSNRPPLLAVKQQAAFCTAADTDALLTLAGMV
jgi:hypothetical protein